jgi:hypothetical protein
MYVDFKTANMAGLKAHLKSNLEKVGTTVNLSQVLSN